MTRVVTGAERLLRDDAGRFRGQRLGLVAHPASVLPGWQHVVDAVTAHEDLDLRALFGPQHGFVGEKQDNMIESASFVDGRTGLPVHSLYGDVRKPTPDMLDGLDIVLFDLQDVGVRIYTFVWTMVLAMEACRDAGVRFVVLDRPNPIGATLREGPLLRPKYKSFVGLHPIPLRHGLTAGELAQLANVEFGIGAELDVIPCEGWQRSSWFDETGLPWVFPSPNLPTLDSCVVYPGNVLLEGTNLSEGRGTTRPFELVGAPWLDARELAAALGRCELPGVHFRPCGFEPTFQKHAGQVCGGVQFHVTDREAFSSVRATVELLRAVRAQAGSDFAWNDPPFEYETVLAPIDILWGSDGLRLGIDGGASAEDILAGSEDELRQFADLAAPHLLYD